VDVHRMDSAEDLRPYLGLGARMSVEW
jgi:hypothetical protein